MDSGTILCEPRLDLEEPDLETADVGGAQADQAFTALSVNKAVNIQFVNVAVGRFNAFGF